MGLFNFLFDNESSVKQSQDKPVETRDLPMSKQTSCPQVFKPECRGLQVGLLLPPNAVAAKERAVQLKRMGDYEGSRSVYMQVRNSFPGDADTYKGLAKLEICRRNYHEAVYNLVMWMELIVHTIKTMNDNSSFRVLAKKNIEQLRCIDGVVLKGLGVSSERMIQMAAIEGRFSDAALTASVNKDPYLMLGLCYIRLFPRDVASMGIPEELLANYENILSGHPTGGDMRGTSYEAPVFAIGLLMALANVRGDVAAMDTPKLLQRWNRRPTYAVYTQTLEDAANVRDANMLASIRRQAEMICRKFGCDARPVHALHIEKLVADQDAYGAELATLVSITRRPLVGVNTGGLSFVAATNRILEDLRYVGDVYAMRMEVLVDDDDYIASNFGRSVSDEGLADWLSRRLNRNVHCGGTRRENGRQYRQFCWCEISQF